jgi:secreted PhoX family phosphatase
MAFSGPARGNSLVQTKFSADGTTTRGTNNNCGNGYTRGAPTSPAKRTSPT